MTAPDARHDPNHLRLLEAILFAAADPIPERVLAQGLPEDADLEGLLETLRDAYAERGVNLVKAGNSWALRTAPDLSRQLNKEVDVPRKLSRAAVETLAIVAYHQPVTRAEIEEIRGVGLSRGTLDVLMEAGWIRPKGRRRPPGRPMTWGTTDAFLDHFGIENVGDLPGMEELKAAGLLDAGPAIGAYRKAAGKADGGDGEDRASGAQLSLIADDEGALDEPPDDSDPLDAPEPLDPGDPDEAEQERA